MGSDFRILGDLEVLWDGDPVPLGSRIQRALLARLLIGGGDVVGTDRLIDDLWQGEPPETADHALHVYVSRLRKVLGPDRFRLQRHGSGYRLMVSPDELDAARFEQLAGEGRKALARGDPEEAGTRLREALRQWRGRAFGDLADDGFARPEAVRLEELRLDALEQRIWADLEMGGHAQLDEELRDLTAQHPFREVFWEQRMVALYRCGRQAEALRVYQAARTTLSRELGIEPGPALQRIQERILAQDPSLDLAHDTAPRQPVLDLPLQRTSFIGRRSELAQAAELLAGTRLLTLTGAPGSGKTRLALRLAADHAGAFPHGVRFVPLVAVTDPRLLDITMARALGLREQPGEAILEGLKAFLCHRRLLLVLDNFEQILPAAPQVGELLDSAPDVKAIVTSRAPLGLSGEQEFHVTPLGVPPLDELPTIEKLSGFDAVALFLARARYANPDFELGPENAASVAGIAVRVDGLPLAIELAAARTRMLPPRDLLDRLRQRLPMLTGGPADADHRHHTMRDAIAWSYELLEPAEKTLFRRLGLFLGGFTLEAAAAVAGLEEDAAMGGIESLIAKSLVHRFADSGPARFAMLEMLREFGVEELSASGERRQVATRLVDCFLGLVERLEPQLTQEPQGSAIGVLDSEVGNLRAALGYALEIDEPDLGLRLAGGLWRYWQSTDQLIEGRDWVERLLACPTASDDALAKGLSALAGIAYWQADYDAAMDGYSKALTIYRRLGDRCNEADTLCAMSLVACFQDDLDATERLAGEAQVIFDEIGSPEGRSRVAMALGYAYWKRGDYATALDLYQQGATIAGGIGNVALATSLQLGISALLHLLGDHDAALRSILRVVAEATEQRNTHVVVWALDVVAAFAAPKTPEPAVRLAGAVDSLRESAGGGIRLESLGLEDARSLAAAVLDPDTLEQAWREGQALDLEHAVGLAEELGRNILGP
jgi:predicted ATPase/DNA-binding winged helix-turn-helix (wHTH) protein